VPRRVLANPLGSQAKTCGFKANGYYTKAGLFFDATRNVLLSPTPADFAAVAQYILTKTAFFIKIPCHSQLAITSGKGIFEKDKILI